MAEYLYSEKVSYKTVYSNVNTQYETVRDSHNNFQNVFAGYSFFYRLKLTFDFSSQRLAAVLSAIAGSGANPELNIAFTVKNPAKVHEELLASAAINAREKAEILCRAAGAELGPLLTIDYSWDELSIISPTRYDLEERVMPMTAAGKCAAPEIQPEDINLHDTAAFVWELK